MPYKDPDAVLDYAVDWTAWLAAVNDTAVAATWIVEDGLTQDESHPPSLVDGLATVWLSGGTHGQSYSVTCRLTTAAGRTDDRTMRIRVGNR